MHKGKLTNVNPPRITTEPKSVQSENSAGDKGPVIILEDLAYRSNTCPLMLSPPVFNPCMRFLSFLSRFISRTKRFRPLDYACLSVELLQSPAADCMIRCSGPYSLLQWTVRSTAADCNNLPFKRPWPTPGNGLFFPLFVI